MRASAAQPHESLEALERRYRKQVAIAELSQLAIAALDADELLPRAHELVREIVGKEIDLTAMLAEPALTDGRDADFLNAIVTVLRALEAQRARERTALAEIEGRFAKIFKHSPIALGMSTVEDGRILDVNDRWLSMFGYSREDVIGRTNAELRINVEPSRRSEIVREGLAAGLIRDAEMQVRTKSGAIIDILASAMPLGGPGEERVWISACVEITNRKRGELERAQVLAREQIARAEAEQAIEQLRAVHVMTDNMSAQGPLGELIGDVLRRLRRTLQIDAATVLLLDDDTRTLYLRAIETEEGRALPSARVPIGAGLSGRVVAEERPLIVDDYATIDSSAIETDDPTFVSRTVSAMAAPFRIGSRVAGVIMVSTRQRRQFTEEELRLLVLGADRVGPAIERGRLIERIRTGVQRQRALSTRLLTAQEEERRRIAVELHDELGQVLTAVKLNLGTLEREFESPATRGKFGAMIGTVDDALQRVKDIALDLRPSVLDDLGLEAALRWFTDRCAQNAGIIAHLSIDSLPRLEPNLQTACFRVTQEAITNVERHARARHVWIDVHVLDGALELSVRDDGVGFDVAAARARGIGGSSVGLLGMQERVTLMGGEYDIIQVATGGTEVRARFPLNAAGPA